MQTGTPATFQDVREVGKHNLPLCDVLVGGFPCQDLSVAGNRAGLAGERSGLFWEFVRIASELHPEWLVLENVPGLLSSNEGRDMGAVVGGLEDIGYSCCWRVLDSQYFGVAQRRRRVFIVGHSRIERAVAVLFEPEGCEGDPQPLRETGTEVAHALDGRTGGVSGKENQETLVSSTIPASQGGASSGMHPLVSHTLSRGGRIDGDTETFVSQTPDPDGVRDFARLPTGMDGRRYRQLGNAVTVQVMEWIARRIMMVDTES